jgi:hypothetical protein
MQNFPIYNAALHLVLAGCINPVSFTEEFREVPAEVPSEELPAVGVQPEEEFTVSIGTGGGGKARSVAGPGAGTIRFGSIRNIAQVIVADTGGKIVAFDEVRRATTGTISQNLSVSIPSGASYHFLVLMGHLNYTVADGNYTYPSSEAPMLLAVGFATTAISGADPVTITMKPVVVDTAFAYGGAEAGAALGGVTLPKDVPAALTWTVTNGFGPLIAAQKAVRGGGGGDEPRFLEAITITGNGVDTGVQPVLSGIGYNEITTNIVTTSLESNGYANFNLKYAPFNLTATGAWTGFVSGAADPYSDPYVDVDDGVPVWIIRNGVNDAAQNDDTTFPASGSTYPWTGTANGNGAVRFTVEDRAIDLTNLVPAPVRGATPVTSFSAPQYTGTVDWTKTVSPGTPPAGLFAADTEYTATVTLTAGAGFTFAGLEDNSFTHGTLDRGTDITYQNPGG